MYVLGEGEESKKWLASPGRSVEQLFLSHVTKVAKAIKKAWPHMTIVMWDDMMRDMSQDVLKGEEEIVLVVLIFRFILLFWVCTRTCLHAPTLKRLTIFSDWSVLTGLSRHCLPQF